MHLFCGLVVKSYQKCNSAKKKWKKKKEVKTSKFFFLEQHNFLWLKITFFFFHKKKKVEKISNWPSNRTIIACTNCSYIPLVKELYLWEKIYPTKNYIFDIFFLLFFSYNSLLVTWMWTWVPILTWRRNLRLSRRQKSC